MHQNWFKNKSHKHDLYISEVYEVFILIYILYLNTCTLQIYRPIKKAFVNDNSSGYNIFFKFEQTLHRRNMLIKIRIILTE